MSIFAGLQRGGIKGPDVVINGDGGSLLPTSSSGMRFSSAQINKTDSLLAGIKPYSYGQGSTSDDISYGVVPHKIQKIVPRFCLPSYTPDVLDDDIILTHSVDDGDVAFTIRMVHDINKRLKDWHWFAKQNITRAVDPIINICTVNYILRGLQTDMGDNNSNWDDFLQATGWPIDREGYHLKDFRSGKYQHRNVSMFIQDYIRPLGVVIGSEHQGGQHQGGGVVDFPVDFVVTILVDGLCDNMLNLWKRTEIRAGDDLFLALCGTQIQEDKCDDDVETGMQKRQQGLFEYQFSSDPTSGLVQSKNFVPASAGTTYVLNHWSKGQVSARFPKHPKLLFELVPTTSSEINEGYFLGDDRRNRGLWHVARSQVHIRGSKTTPSGSMQTFRQDTANLKTGGLVQATIAPMWKSAARHRSKHCRSGHVVSVRTDRVDNDASPAKKYTSSDDNRTFQPNLRKREKKDGISHESMQWAKQDGSHRTHPPVVTNMDGTMYQQSPMTYSSVGANVDVEMKDVGMKDVVSSIARRSSKATGASSKKSVLESVSVTSALPTVEPVSRVVTDMPIDTVPVNNDVVAPDVNITSKVYARSVNATSGDVSAKPVSVARVSSKKRADVAP